MKITSLLTGYPDPTTLGKRQEAAEPAGTTAIQAAVPAAPAASDTTAALRQIVSEYDVTDISPRAFSEMIQRLHQAGALSDSQYQELSLIRLDLDLEGIEPTDKIDLVDLYDDKLRKLRDQGPERAAPDDPAAWEPIQRRLEWLQKFAVMQSQADSIGLDLSG